MTARGFRVGDRVRAPAESGQAGGALVEGRVVAFRDLDGTHQKLWIKSEDNRNDVRMVMVDLAGSAIGEPSGRISLGPIAFPTAEMLARSILEGREIRLPVEAQLNTLATAVLQAERPKAGLGLVRPAKPTPDPHEDTTP